MKLQRIRDPIHDLIEFRSKYQLERVLWNVIQTEPFQRLRRVKQLGFSDIVYPGACHSRFAHSLGVFHTARNLMKIVKNKIPQELRNEAQENCSLAAALLHDVGHGAFSHAFEKVGERLNLEIANHEFMSERIIRESEISKHLQELGSGFANDVSNVLGKGGNKSVHHAVVSSQFDADRLDYMQRDRFMAGTKHAGIDFNWLLANLDVGEFPTGTDDTQTGSIWTFVLNPKAIHAAEAYVLGLFQLYPTVYFHKATRGAEKLFVELMVRVIELARNSEFDKLSLPNYHPICKFACDLQNYENAILLDDSVVWGALSQLSESKDKFVSEFATRIRLRRLYKCKDYRLEVEARLNPKNDSSAELLKKIDETTIKIREKLTEAVSSFPDGNFRILLDFTSRTPYKSFKDSQGALSRINIKTEGGEFVDLAERSVVVKSLTDFKVDRVYFSSDDREAIKLINNIIDGELK